MHRGFLKTAALLAAFSVAMGAFAAHGLKDMISSRAVAIFETGVRYQFYHVFALFIAAILYREFPTRKLLWAGRMFIVGIVLFSGSLYLLTAVEGMVQPGYKWIGAITPFGGLAFIAGWLLLFAGVLRRG
jgi:uncharacterized membrane protein YgdD (TMEM256/DUF423 family)